MPLCRDRIAEAAAAQQAAAADPSPHVRVVAGPGTGKSATIEARVCWLLGEGVPPEAILAISFTRAAARDLQLRITKAREDAGLGGGEAIAVSTLHSLALRTLRRAGALAAYPAEPVVLQQWELRNIYDAEFGKTVGIGSITRRDRSAGITRPSGARETSTPRTWCHLTRPSPRTNANTSTPSTGPARSSTPVSCQARSWRAASR